MDKKPNTKKAKKGSIVKWLFIVPISAAIVILGYENATQHYYPAYSILSALHRSGLFTSVPALHRPSKGIWLPLGWLGGGMMCTLMVYSLRKRVHALNRLGLLKNWLLVHIFLGLMGPTLIVFHTTFKLNGLVATSFWAMIVTMCFGMLGRYIYVQIPRSINGTELKSGDIDALVASLDKDLGEMLPDAKLGSMLEKIIAPGADAASMNPLKALFFYIRNDFGNMYRIMELKAKLKSQYNLPGSARREIVSVFKRKAALVRKRSFLKTSQTLLNYWHVIHIPLALLMFFIMFLHIAAYFIFRPTV
ncbi:MAG: hypothetical protein HYV24_03445 [Deltaproteobacteria bacterium]|nr:hypothetical protein [Deltaproteobacteria bacterium]